jgi:hypothetical protein
MVLSVLPFNIILFIKQNKKRANLKIERTLIPQQ